MSQIGASSASYCTRLALLMLALVSCSTTLTAGSEEALFLAESSAAMARMMTAMDIKPTGDIDADFAAMMIPHHQGAIEMAQAQLRYGRNEQLRRIAQEIIVTQEQEISAMKLAVGRPFRPFTLSPVSQPMMHIHQEP